MPLGFCEIVDALRQKLGILETLTLPEAVVCMSELMGLPSIDANGKPVPLPEQVEALAESINLSMPLDSVVLHGSVAELSEEEEESESSSAQSPASLSRSKKPLKQRKSPLS